jgi:hypothetical protein
MKIAPISGRPRLIVFPETWDMTTGILGGRSSPEPVTEA